MDDDKSNQSLVKTQHNSMAQSPRRLIISELPNEMLRAILVRVQLPQSIRFRSVNKRWKLVIEDICRDKKCLVVMDRQYEHYLYTLPSRFNGYLNLNRTNSVVFIRINSRAHSSAVLCPILAQLFPQIEQFCTNVEVLYSSARFISMLKQWSPSLSALSLSNRITELYDSHYSQINKLSNLRQLHLDSFDGEIAAKLTPTLSRLEHLSIHVYPSITEIVPLLGSRLTSLALLNLRFTIEEWRNVSAQFVSRLERLSLFACDPQVLPFICNHFSSLQMLRIDTRIGNGDTLKFTAETIEHLAQLTHLTELRFDSIVIDLVSLLNVTINNLRPLHNIRVLSLVDFTFVSSNYDGTRVGRAISTIFPNVAKLIIKSQFYKMLGYSLESHVKLFPNLRSFDFGLDDLIQSFDGLTL